MNDIPNVSDVFNFILFADDTGLFSSIEYSIWIHPSNVNEILNHELAEVCHWLTLNKLSLNIKNTKLMVFYPYQKDISGMVPQLTINGTKLEHVLEFRNLGVVFDEHMSWKPCILSNRLLKYAGILNKPNIEFCWIQCELCTIIWLVPFLTMVYWLGGLHIVAWLKYKKGFFEL